MLQPISKKDFFYVVNDNYDDHITYAIHYYKEMHKEIQRCLNDKIQNPTILDLGCGSGITSSIILDFYPQANVIAIDLFEEMLTHAKKRLQQYQNQITYVQGDFRVCDLGNGIDVCISALALHHILPLEKKFLFQKIYNSLNVNGRFIMIDWSKFNCPWVAKKAAEIAIDHAAKSIVNHEIVDSWAFHWENINIPDTVEDMLNWLKNAGFSYSECVFRYYGLSMIVAEK